MTLPLRAFLMLRSVQGEWSVTVYRDLDALLIGWSAKPEGTQVGVLHVGFDRPASVLFDPIACRFPDRMLVTASAKSALPRAFEASAEPVGAVEGLPVHLASRGWGYVLSEHEIASAPARSEAPFTPQGWIKEFLRQHRDAEASLRRVGIQDDSDYLEKEYHLEKSLRFQSGIFRYRQQIRPSDEDPCELVKAAPPWFLDRPINTIELTVRVANVFSAVRIGIVRDLLAYDVDQLLHIPNFGRKSVRDLYVTLLAALNEGPHDIETKVNAANTSTLLQEIRKSLANLDDRAADIVKRRIGFGVPAETLNEIGTSYGLTRERIRQIEAKSLKALLKSAYWDRVLVSKLEALLLGRDFPLPLLGLDAVDPWFKGVGKSNDLLSYILFIICDGRFSVVRIDGIDYVGRVTQDDWKNALREARRILASGSDDRWSEEQCRTLVDSVLGESRREFRSVFWSQASLHCHFSDVEGGGRVLASYGRGTDQAVEAVLLDSPAPLHYSEIAVRATQRSGRDVDVRRAQNAAASIGILLGRGIYGLEHHINIAEAEAEVVRDQLEQVILDGPDDRQWHTSELLAVVTERTLKGALKLDKYKLDYVLKRSGVLRPLGRMTWMKRVSSSTGRIDVKQAIVAVLQQAGSPLSTNEIRQRLVALRGVGDHFQIYSSDNVVKVDAENWGLNDRDILLKRPDQPGLLNRLEKVLRAEGAGIHISEIVSALFRETRSDEVLSPETIISIATTDARFQSNLSQYVFLREWGDARRDTLASAALKALSDGPKSFDEVMADIGRFTRRSFDKRTVISMLFAIEAKLDAVTKNWTLPTAEAEDTVITDIQNDVPSSSLIAEVDWDLPNTN